MKPPARPAPGSLAKKKTVTMAADPKKATSSAAAKVTSPLSPAAKTSSKAAFTSPSTPSTPAASKSATAQGFGKGQEVALLQHDPQQNAMTVLDHTQIKDYSQLQIAAWRPDVQVDSEIAAKSIFSGASIETYMERQLRELIDDMKVFVQKTRLLLTFEITARRLQLMMSLGNIRALEDLGGADGVCRLLRVTPAVGLTKEERLDAYDDRCEHFGVNNFPRLVGTNPAQILMAFFSDTAFLLVVAFALVHFCGYCSFNAAWGWADAAATIGGMIITFIINALFELWKIRIHLQLEEERLDFEVDVRRENMRVEIDCSEVLVGDILIIDKGDRAAADGIILYSSDFWVDESAVNPSDVYIPKVEHWAPFVLAGTKVIEGWAEMVVTAVGRRTLWMTTMDTVVVNDGLSPHFAKQRKVVQDVLSKTMKASFIMCVGYPILHSIALAAAGKVPKFLHWLVVDPLYMGFYCATLLWFAACSGLPNVGTVVWSLLLPELQKPARMNRLEVWSARHLEAAAMCNEMLVDKTGFAAKPQLTVETICLSGLGPLEDAIAMVEKDSASVDVMPPAIKHLLESCMLYRVEVSQHIQFDEILKRPVLMWEGHDIDVALVKWFRKLNPAVDFESIRGQMVPNILKEFEEEVDALRRHGILVRFENVFHYYCIGAAEFVLPLCDTGILPGGNLFDLNEEELLTINRNIDTISSQGLKPIMCAYREIRDASVFLSGETNMLMEAPPEDHLCCLAIFGLRQRIALDAPEVIDFMRDSGCQVRLVSNDHIDPVTYIAREVGVLSANGQAVTSYELDSMDEMGRFSAYYSAQVFARFTHVDKYNMIRRLQDMDRVVMCTSYRAVDTACMLQADCAIGLGNAVQGLHECTGIAIAEDQPATPLIDAVLWSRYFWYCITKQTQFQLTAVLTVVLFSLVGAFTFSSFPLHPFHLIDLNLMIDTLSPMCLCYERMRLSLERYLIALKPDEIRNVSITPEMRREILGQAAYQTTLVSFIYLIAPAAFPERYTDPMINGEPSNLKLGSFCYNLIWWMNYFNLFNCRCLIPRVTNPFSNIHNDWDFLIWSILIVAVHFTVNSLGGDMVTMPAINTAELIICVGLGMGGIAWRFLLRRTPMMLFDSIRNWKLRNLKMICRKQSYEKYRVYPRKVKGHIPEDGMVPLFDDEYVPRLVKDRTILVDYESEDEIDEDTFAEMEAQRQHDQEVKERRRAAFMAEHGFAPEDDEDLPEVEDELNTSLDVPSPSGGAGTTGGGLASIFKW